MSSFTSPLQVKVLSGKKHGRLTVELLEPFTYYTNDCHHITVPAGFVTDFASVPRVLWGIAPPFGPYAKAAVVHDYLCERKLAGFGRRVADAEFYTGMRVLGVNIILAWSMWAAVRVAAVVKGKK